MAFPVIIIFLGDNLCTDGDIPDTAGIVLTIHVEEVFVMAEVAMLAMVVIEDSVGFIVAVAPFVAVECILQVLDYE